MASSKISRTQAENGTKKLTISAWVKKSGLGVDQTICTSFYSTSYYGYLRFNGSDQLVFGDYRNSTLMILATNALFRDTAAWYHVVATFDATVGSPQAKIYVNGVLQTLANNTNYSQNSTTSWNTDYPFTIGSFNNGEYLNGSLADFYYIQGQSYDASTFGETDATTGIWKPILNPTIDYSSTGTNSCHLKFEDASNLDLDSGDNNLTFSTSGTPTQTQDCPSNNYPSVNLQAGKATEYLNSTGLRFGNTEINQTGNPGVFISTLANTTGKYYWEMFVETVGYTTQGVIAYDALIQTGAVTYLYTPAAGYGYVYTGNKGNSQVSYGNSYTSGDYISVAFDQTNGSIWFAKNGVWQNSATTAEIGAGTTTNSAYSSMPTNGNVYAPAFGLDNSAVTRINYGNGTFGTTTLSTTYSPTVGDTSAKFKYNIIPTGFTAVSTKGYNA
jgi:hypothetical protein